MNGKGCKEGTSLSSDYESMRLYNWGCDLLVMLHGIGDFVSKK